MPSEQHEYSALFLVDPATIFLGVLACSLVWYGSARGSRISAGGLLAGEGLEHAQKGGLKMWMAVALPLCGSVVLIGIFYFFSILRWVLVPYFFIMSCLAVTVVAQDWVVALGALWHRTRRQSTSVPFEQRKVVLPCIGDAPLSVLISFSIGCILSCVWLTLLLTERTSVSRNILFALSNVLAACLAVLVIMLLRINSLKVALVLLSIFFLYDVFWVFVTAIIANKGAAEDGPHPAPTPENKSVMESVALSLLGTPAMFIIPSVLLGGWRILGLGDVVLPGLLLCFLYRVDIFLATPEGLRTRRGMMHGGGISPVSASVDGEGDPIRPTGCRDGSNRLWFRLTPRQWGYFNIAFVGYVLGITATYVSLVAMQTAQPALLFLVPFTVVPVLLTSWRRAELLLLLRGPLKCVNSLHDVEAVRLDTAESNYDDGPSSFSSQSSPVPSPQLRRGNIVKQPLLSSGTE